MFPGLQSLFQFIPKVVDWGQSLCRPKFKNPFMYGSQFVAGFFLVSTGRPSAYTVVSYYGLKRLCVFMLDDIHEIHLAHTKSVCNCIYVPSALYEYLAWLNKISSQTIKTLKVCSQGFPLLLMFRTAKHINTDLETSSPHPVYSILGYLLTFRGQQGNDAWTNQSKLSACTFVQ